MTTICPKFGTLAECHDVELCIDTYCSSIFRAARIARPKTNRYLIGWTKDPNCSGFIVLQRPPGASPKIARWLFQNEQGETMLLHLPDKASRFTREETNLILLTFYNAGSRAWNAPGLDYYPVLVEDMAP